MLGVFTAATLLSCFWIDLHVVSQRVRVAAKAAILALSASATWWLVDAKRTLIGSARPDIM
jgi:hypothetical protein